MDAVLELVDVRKAFDGVEAVRGLDFSVAAGSVTGLMGPNGAGKSTAVNLISGLLRPDAGSILVGGVEVAGLRADRIARLGLARTHQTVRLARGMTALQQVISGCFRRRGVSLLASVLHTPGAMARMEEMEDEALYQLDRLGMADRADVLAEALSYGEQRRVEIARALATGPSLLLLDEPTAGMNAQESERIAELIRTLRDEGVAVLLVEHNMRVVTDTCDRAVVMNFGEKIAEGPPAACFDDLEVQEAYFGRERDAGR